MDLYSTILEEIVNEQDDSPTIISQAITKPGTISSIPKARELVHYLQKLTRIRTNAIKIISKALGEMNRTADCSVIKRVLLHESTKLLSDGLNPSSNHSHFKLLSECIKVGFVSRDEVANTIIERAKKKKYPRLIFVEFLFSFPDILREYDEYLFDSLRYKLERILAKNIYLNCYKESLEKLRTPEIVNDGILETEFEVSSIEYAIINDNAKLCMQRIADYGKSVDTIVLPNAFCKKPEFKYEHTFLSLAALYGSISCFKGLILQGASLTTPEKTPSIVQLAIAGGNLEILQILKHSNDCSFEDACEYAAKYCRRDVLEWLLGTVGAEPTKQALENAFILDDIESARIIIDACKKLEIDPLFNALNKGLPLVTTAAQHNAVKCLELLKECGASFDNEDYLNKVFTPMVAALSSASISAAEFLEREGMRCENAIESAAKSDCVDALDWVLAKEKPERIDIIKAHGDSIYLCRFDSTAYLEEHFPDIVCQLKW